MRCDVREHLLRRLLDWWIETQQPTNFGTAIEDYPATRWFLERGAADPASYLPGDVLRATQRTQS